MRKLAFLALSLVAVGCSTEIQGTEASPPEATGDGVTVAQTQAFKALRSDTHRAWTWVQHADLKTPMHLEAPRGTGKPILVKGGDAVKTTVSFVDQYKALFKMRDAASELRVERTETDELSMTHARFQQVVRGVPVVGAELAAHYDAAGRLASIDANYVADLDALDLEPALTVDRGAEIAKADVAQRTPGIDVDQLPASDGKLVVFALDGRAPKLAYEYSVRAVFGHEPAIWVTTVDAKTGEIIDRYNNLQTIEATGMGVLGVAKKFQVSQSGASYAMLDATRGAQIRTYTAANQETIPGTTVTSNSLTTWDRTAAGAGAAVDAHFNATAVYDYYKTVHARNAIDGTGGALVSTAHFGQQFDNAFWDPQLNQMAYGDGGQYFRPLSAGLDVVAHEFTHGVTSATSNLRYQNQPGAMNEAVSDIFGAFIEHSVKADPAKNWQMGEDIARQAGLLRDLRNPAVGQQPAHMSRYVNTQQDDGGVHINSGIPNNAAYLMTVGGSNPVSKVEVKYGIGWEKAEKLWYRANTKYFLTSTNFAQAATGVMSAAKDIGLTPNEQNIVECAWKATGVMQGACATMTDPKSTTPAPSGGDEPGDSTDPGGTPGEDDGSGDVGDEGDEGADGTGTGTSRRKPRTTTTVTSSGCSAAPHGTTDIGALAGVFAALGLAAAARRRRR